MRSIVALLLPTMLFSATSLQAAPAEVWTAERCAALRQLSQPDLKVQQQLQQHCAQNKSSEQPAPNVIAVQLNTQLPVSAAQEQPAAEQAQQRIRHNSTLETLGSAMLVVLVGFWFWMGRK